MEFFLSRAMEVCRLSPEQLKRLHEFENQTQVMRGFDQRTNTYKEIVSRIPRCLLPLEIQSIFGLPQTKERYEMPTDNESVHSSHNQRLRGELRAAGLVPHKGDFNITDIDDVHVFDEKIREANQSMQVNLQCSIGNVSRRKRASDEF